MNYSILKDCPVCHNFQPEPEESLTRIRGAPVQNSRKALIPTNAAGEHGFDIEVEIEEVRNQASNACHGCALLYQGFQTWKFQILAVDGHRAPWKTLGKTTPSPRYVLTDEHRDWYLSWVQDCVENHPKCHRSSAMPTRLIDLGDKGTMCLRDEINQTSRYIALSHSWQYSEARKIFQDAIKVARWLGVRYLWIDTFCIIQDDPDDWAEQAPRMGEIFEGAYVTLAVDCDLDSPPTDGCFLERNIVHEVALTDVNGDECLVGMVCARAPSLAPHPPLSAMGERREYWRVKSNKEGLVDILCMSGHGQELNRDKCWEVWRDVVRVYSGADLTVPTDRLAALSSMAQRMPRQIFGDYLAGLWPKNLIQELIWRHDHKRKGRFFRYKQYVAPTFLWASIYGGSIDIDWRFDGSMEPKASLLDAGTVPATDDPMGPILEGFIHMWYAFFDDEDDMEELVGQKVCLGAMLKGSRSLVFLVMREVADRKGVFQRIGIGELFWVPWNCPGPLDPFYQIPEQEIRLI
ncbi:hypothetical protein BDV24DRAFT_176846 [Aspergillus arachidicola]|uniref:Heterokaryon incompatibility domain-containing protein n=1 Tax=Aspergillus arachidicola TaxID=656916 RepID=A0A5N6XYH7_9EURO|nr:hypothetical protein BDV24DRAFT_176846 [Aspergillus arachidicola]